MNLTTDFGQFDLTPDEETAVREILGYLNFSNGKPDLGFEAKLNLLHRSLPAADSWGALRNLLTAGLTHFADNVAAFADNTQASEVIRLVFDQLWPAYRQHHGDLLFHLTDSDFQHPFFLARLFEAVLSQTPPWNETGRIVAGALDSLNDYIGFRPLAVLENGRQMEPYSHERFRPIPLYIQGAGVGEGPYRELIERTIAFLGATPESILHSAYFDFRQLDELAVDVRAHDHTHPVNKRTNYMFGEWDPHQIDTDGRYRRFVVRKIILDALLRWIDERQDEVSRDELLYDTSAVLCGTILMASAISGSGPDAHDSSVTLTSLLPKVARQRDMFYARLLQEATGDRAQRLATEAQLFQQPFGHVRQYLNLHLANYGARQVQHRYLAQLYARMGYVDASREQAAIIPSASARFESEIQWRNAVAHLHLDQGRLDEAITLLQEIEGLIYRGIECGALVDPWNILGFQAQFPLFSSREDSIPDQRIETLLEIMEQTFGLYSKVLSEAAALGRPTQAEQVSVRFRALADFWDRFATTVVEDLPKVSGQESFASGTHVAQALSEWHKVGEAAGDISFWHRHVDGFQSAKAFALVVDTMLEKHDYVAAMALLIQWLGQASGAGLESGPHSIHALLLRWMNRVTSPDAEPAVEDRWRLVRRFFDFMEANAGEYWSVPQLQEITDNPGKPRPGEPSADGGLSGDDALHPGFAEEMDEDDEEDFLFQAAYDDVVYRDSAFDGNVGDTLDTGQSLGDSEFESISRQLEPRLKFLVTLAQLWQIAVTATCGPRDGQPEDVGDVSEAELEERRDVLESWQRRVAQLQTDLGQLLNSVWERQIAAPSGDHDSNVEYDMQLQTKFYLLHTIIATHVNCRIAERSLLCCLPVERAYQDMPEDERLIGQVYRGVLTRDVPLVRQLLPMLLRKLARKPLLYIPLENGGHPMQILAARTLQTDIRFLLSQLPRLGLLRETWHLLRTAYRMERASRPSGLAVTEFDRIFRTALRSSLESVVEFSTNWKSGKFSDEDLVDIVGEIVERYLDQWLKHSRTTRLSYVEGIESDDVWEETKEFIQKYGDDLFHAKMLTLGNVRAILHNGIEWFLGHLVKTEDVLHPIQLLRDLETGVVESEHVVDILELVYGAVVDKFERFLEYNTTTTQSDYGEMFYCLLDFLRVEAGYDRDAWNFTPVSMAHKVLSRRGRMEAVEIWEQVFRAKSSETADQHLARLAELEKTYGVRLPSITDRLNECFMKPMAVNRMLALIPPAIQDARAGQTASSAFETLREEIDDYLENTLGSGIDVPQWLQDLEKEVSKHDPSSYGVRHRSELEFNAAPVPLTLREMHRQLKIWQQPLTTPRPRKKKDE